MTAGAAIFLPPWDTMDDAALLAHFRGKRDVAYFPVADAEETRREKIDALMVGRFEFNGQSHLLPEPIQWLHNPSSDVEWHILLHKFYYAVGLGLAFQSTGHAAYAHRWVDLIDSWIAATPAGFIAADVTGRRVQNWIYSLHLFVGHAAHDTATVIQADFHRRLLWSLHEQVEFLCNNLTEKRNHRTLELYAIFLAGVVFPEMQRAAFWRSFAMEQTVANLASDLLPDGVHCELSTDYHHLVLKNALNFRRLAGMNGVVVPTAFDDAVQRGLEFSLHVHQPNGDVPSLSDGDARSYLELLQQGADLYGRADMLYVATQGARGSPPSQRAKHFETSGYSTLRSGWGHAAEPFAHAQHLVFDCGPLGEGNHGHFDCLNFELAAQGRALIVDPGRYTYSESVDPGDGINWRVRFRSTAVHNTVCVDGQNQTRYLPKAMPPGTRHASGSVRHKISGPAPDTRWIERHHGPTLDLLHGQARSHEYDAVHDRCMVFVDRRYWIVSDALRAATAHRYRLNFQLGVQAQDRSHLWPGKTWRLDSPNLLMWQPARPGMDVTLCPSWVSARYGHKQAAPALQSTVQARDIDFDTVLMPFGDRAPAVTVESVAVQAEDQDPDHGDCAAGAATALRITLQVDGALVVDHWFHARGRSAALWCVGDFAFSGLWAYWRTAADGRVLRVVSHPGASLPTAAELASTA
jgi:uncharacterized heparinase superfamily protein